MVEGIIWPTYLWSTLSLHSSEKRYMQSQHWPKTGPKTSLYFIIKKLDTGRIYFFCGTLKLMVQNFWKNQLRLGSFIRLSHYKTTGLKNIQKVVWFFSPSNHHQSPRPRNIIAFEESKVGIFASTFRGWHLDVDQGTTTVKWKKKQGIWNEIY